MAKRVRAYIGMGANIGDPVANLERAVRALSALPDIRVRDVSPLYQTKPVGPVDQPDFVNAVVAIDVAADADSETAAVALLGQLKRIERELGRHERERWGPREIDLDLLLFGDHRIDRRADPWLVVPHPEMANRLFVLEPLADLVPDIRPPGWSESVTEARDRRLKVDDRSAVRLLGQFGGTWLS